MPARPARQHAIATRRSPVEESRSAPRAPQRLSRSNERLKAGRSGRSRRSSQELQVERGERHLERAIRLVVEMKVEQVAPGYVDLGEGPSRHPTPADDPRPVARDAGAPEARRRLGALVLP